MRESRVFVAIVAVILTFPGMVATASSPRDTVILSCEMTNYGQSLYNQSNALQVAKSWIPEKSVHSIEFPATQLVTWGDVFGEAERVGSNKIKLTYRLGGGKVVSYTYFSSTNIVYGRAIFPGYLGIDSVRGTCELE